MAIRPDYSIVNYCSRCQLTWHKSIRWKGSKMLRCPDCHRSMRSNVRSSLRRQRTQYSRKYRASNFEKYPT